MDNCFGGTGFATTTFNGNEYAQDVIVDPAGYILHSAELKISPMGYGLARYQVDGTLDSTFNGSGTTTAIHTPEGSATAASLLRQSDGKYVVTGSTGPGTDKFSAACFNSDGTLDTTYGEDGLFKDDFGASGGALGAGGALQADDSLVMTGKVSDNLAVVRLTSAGVIDTAFNGGAPATTTLSGQGGFGHAALVQPDGKILSVGYLTFLLSRYMTVARFNSDGTLDTAFSGDGWMADVIALPGEALAGALQSDGKIVIGGAGTFFIIETAIVARLTTAGALDTSFSGDGVATPLGALVEGKVTGIAVQGDGKIVGSMRTSGTSGVGVVRLLSNGNLDTTFNGTGFKWYNVTGTAVNQYATGIAIQTDGKYVLSFTYQAGANWRSGVVRIMP